MKRKLTISVLFVLTLAVIQSCVSDKQKSLEDKQIEALRRLLRMKDDKNVYPGGKIIPQELAEDCIKEYDRIYEPATDTAAMQFAFTEDVRFGVHGLLEWMIKVTDSTDVDNIRVFNGIYTEKMAAAYPMHTIYPGRVTVFLWPYHGDKKAVWKKGKYGGGDGKDTTGAYNLGNVLP